MGNKDKDNPRSSLPLGADIDNPNVIGISVPDVTSPNIKENQWYNKGAVYPIIRINDHYLNLQKYSIFLWKPVIIRIIMSMKFIKCH